MMKRGMTALWAMTCMTTSVVSAEETREHGVHAHGMADLNVVTEGNQLLIEWISPSANIVGFEYSPVTEEEKAAVRQAEEALGQAQDLFGIPAEAQCLVEHVDIKSHMLAEHEGEEHHDEHEGEEHHDEHEGEAHHDEHEGDEHHEHEGDSGVHSEYSVTYEFNCTQMDKLTEINVNLFDVFPLTESLNVQLVTASGQTQKTLDKNDSLLEF